MHYIHKINKHINLQKTIVLFDRRLEKILNDFNSKGSKIINFVPIKRKRC